MCLLIRQLQMLMHKANDGGRWKHSTHDCDSVNYPPLDADRVLVSIPNSKECHNGEPYFVQEIIILM